MKKEIKIGLIALACGTAIILATCGVYLPIAALSGLLMALMAKAALSALPKGQKVWLKKFIKDLGKIGILEMIIK